MLQGSVAEARLRQAIRTKSQQMTYPIGGALGLLGLWMTILLLPYSAESCMETAWINGRLGNETFITGFTLDSTVSDTCRCCALCHRYPTCASLSFNSLTAECELYSSVASYATLQPDKEEHWTYFVMPGRSQHEQFCRQDSDCLEEGDACRGRVCTDRETITCRVICEELGAGRRYGGNIPRMYGWLNGQSLMMTCWINLSNQGFTLLLSSLSGLLFDKTTVLDYNRALNTEQYSILGLVEDLRHSNNDTPTYTIEIWAPILKEWNKLTIYKQSRDQPVLGVAPREAIEVGNKWKSQITWRATKLYIPQSGNTLVSINANGAETGSSEGALASDDGDIKFKVVTVYIRE